MKKPKPITIDTSNLSDAQKRKMIDDWFQKEGGFKQLEINSVKVCSDYASYSREDALFHTIEYFLGLPLEKQFKVYCDGGMEFYITRAMALQVKSSSSSFYHKYRKPLLKERELLNDRGEEFHPDYLTDNEELTGKMKCLRYFYDNELNMADRWLVKEMIFNSKKLKHIALEYEIPERDLTTQWTSLKARLKRQCKSY